MTLFTTAKLICNSNSKPDSPIAYAIKVYTVKATNEHNAGLRLELAAHEKLDHRRKTNPDFFPHFVGPLVGHFTHSSSAGQHLCLAFIPQGQSVSDWVTVCGDSPRLPNLAVKKIIRDVATALRDLHAAGVVHTGVFQIFLWLFFYLWTIFPTDLKVDNILLGPQGDFVHVLAGEDLAGLSASTDTHRSVTGPVFPCWQDWQPDDPGWASEHWRFILSDLGQGEHLRDGHCDEAGLTPRPPQPRSSGYPGRRRLCSL